MQGCGGHRSQGTLSSWLSSEAREHFKDCCNYWKLLKQRKMKRLLPDFNARAVVALCWPKNTSPRRSLSARAHKDCFGLASCRDARQKGGITPGREEEGRGGAADSRGLRQCCLYKQGFWRAGLYCGAELVHLRLQESGREMKAD